MNWLVFALATWIAVGLELGLRDALSMGSLRAAPSFLLILATYIAMLANPRTALWVGLLLGLLTDLLNPIPSAIPNAPSSVLVGPWTLSYVLAAQLVLSLRPLMIRRNPLTLAFLTLGAGLVTAITSVAILSWRAKVFEPIAWDATQQLWGKLATAPYSGVIALFIAFALLPLSGPFGFPTQARVTRGNTG